MYEEGRQVSKEDEREARRKEYFAGFLAAAALVSGAALLWYAGSNGRALFFKVVGSSVIGGASVVWLLWWDDVRSDWKKLEGQVDYLIAECVKGGMSVQEAHETIIYLGMMGVETREQTIEYADIPNSAKTIFLAASEQTWQDWIYAIKQRR